MGSFSRITRGAGAVVLASGALLTASSPAWSATAGRRVVHVPCDTPALAAAITAANAPGGAVLLLARRCTYTVTTPATAGTGLPAITGDVTLVGGPATTIRRDMSGAAFRVLDVAAGGRLRVIGISILDGSTAGLGGGIRNAGTLVLRRVTLSGNRAGSGGGVANLANARATVSRTLFAANTTTGVGGGALLNFGVATIGVSVIKANTAPINGGGVNTQPSGVTVLSRSVVEANTSGSLGGGLANLGSTTLNRGVVERNRGSGGGGIATANDNVVLSHSIVRNNQPGNCSPPNTVQGCVN